MGISSNQSKNRPGEDESWEMGNACSQGDLEKIAFFAAKGLDFEYPCSPDLLTPLGKAAQAGSVPTMDMLLSMGVKIDAVDGDKMGAIHRAAKANQAKAVLHLARHGVSIDAPCGGLYDCRSPLLLSLLSGDKSYKEREACAMALLAAGANPHLADRNGNTPLHAAAELGMPLLCEVLLARGVDVNAKNKFGWTPLFSAASCGWSECMGPLIAHGALVDARDLEKQSALHIAAEGGFEEACQVLVRSGAKKMLEDQSGRTPVNVAMDAGYEECAALIESTPVLVDIGSALRKRAVAKKSTPTTEFSGKPRP